MLAVGFSRSTLSTNPRSTVDWRVLTTWPA
jgi:hypothetical protein